MSSARTRAAHPSSARSAASRGSISASARSIIGPSDGSGPKSSCARSRTTSSGILSGLGRRSCSATRSGPSSVDPIAPAQRSAAALRKTHTQRLPGGTPVHSFRTLLAGLGSARGRAARPRRARTRRNHLRAASRGPRPAGDSTGLARPAESCSPRPPPCSLAANARVVAAHRPSRGFVRQAQT